MLDYSMFVKVLHSTPDENRSDKHTHTHTHIILLYMYTRNMDTIPPENAFAIYCQSRCVLIVSGTPEFRAFAPSVCIYINYLKYLYGTYGDVIVSEKKYVHEHNHAHTEIYVLCYSVRRCGIYFACNLHRSATLAGTFEWLADLTRNMLGIVDGWMYERAAELKEVARECDSYTHINAHAT